MTTPADLALPATLTPESVAATLASLRALESDGGGAPVIVRGGADVFCDGMDLAAHGALDDDALRAALAGFVSLLGELRFLSRPTIAVVEGRVAGGGVGIAAACDYVLAADAATFALPEVLLGLAPSTIAPLLLERVAPQALRVLALHGGSRPAADLVRAGLVDEVAPLASLGGRAASLRRAFARGARGAVVEVKRLGVRRRGLEREMTRGAERTLRRLRDPETLARIGAMREGGTPWLA